MRNSFVGILAFIMILFSCEKPDSKIGLELLPDEEFLGLELDSSTVLVRTVLHDSIPTRGLTSFLLGDYIDDELGDRVKANLFFQVRIGNPNVNFGENPILDSMVLSLAYVDSSYGDLAPMNLNLERLAEDIDSDSSYFSYSSLSTMEVNLLDSQNPYTFDVENEVVVGEDTLAPQLRMRLDDLGEELLLAPMDSLVDSEVFLPYFKGFKLSAEIAGGDNGSLVNIDPYSALSKMTIYYRNNTADSLSYEFAINQFSQIFSQFEHEYVGDISDQINGIGGVPEQVYIQSPGGTGIEVTLPNLFDFTEEENLVINRAILELPLAEGQDLEFHVPNPQVMAAIQVDSTLVITPDGSTANQFGDSFEGGDYDSSSESYQLNVTRFVQRVLNGQIEEPVFLVIPTFSKTVGNRAIIKVGDLSEDRRIKLKINYTTY